MYRTIVIAAILVLIASTVAPAGSRGRRSSGITQEQITEVMIGGGTSGFGDTVASSGASASATQRARTKCGSACATQSASSSVGSSSSSWWGAVKTWFCGYATTWQKQQVK
jgi:hypothetical protein